MASKKGKVAKTGIHDARVTTRRFTLHERKPGVNASGLRICRYHPAIARLRQLQDGKLKAWPLVTEAKGSGAEWHRGAYMSATIAQGPTWNTRGCAEGSDRRPDLLPHELAAFPAAAFWKCRAWPRDAGRPVKALYGRCQLQDRAESNHAIQELLLPCAVEIGSLINAQREQRTDQTVALSAGSLLSSPVP